MWQCQHVEFWHQQTQAWGPNISSSTNCYQHRCSYTMTHSSLVSFQTGMAMSVSALRLHQVMPSRPTSSCTLGTTKETCWYIYGILQLEVCRLDCKTWQGIFQVGWIPQYFAKRVGPYTWTWLLRSADKWTLTQTRGKYFLTAWPSPPWHEH